MKKSCLVLVAHGIKNPQWTVPFESLVGELIREVGKGRIWISYTDLSSSSLQDVAGKIIEEEITHFRLLPLFLADGNHLEHDLPTQVEALHRCFSGLEVEILPPVGRHPMFASLMRQLVRESVR